MDRTTRQIIEGLKSVTAQTNSITTLPATVQRVNNQLLTCEVITAEGITLYDVQLQAAAAKDAGWILYPAPGSVVLVSCTEAGNWYVSAFTEIAGARLRTQADDFKQWLTDLIAAIQSITVTTATGPSGIPINQASFNQLRQRLDNLLT